MLTKLWNANQQTTPAATSRPNGVGRHGAIRSPRQSTTPSSTMIAAPPTKPELLPRDGEDEVGLLLGDELPVGLAALEQPLAEQPAGADRDPGLRRCCSRRPGGSLVRVRERGEPGHLVGLEQAAADQRPNAGQRRRPATSPATQRVGAPDTASTPRIDEDAAPCVVPKSGCSMTSAHRHRGQRQHQQHVAVRGAVLAVAPLGRAASPSRPRGRPWRTPTAAPGTPPPSTIHECGAVDRRAERASTATRPTQRADVHQRRVRAQRAVVHASRDHRAQHQPDDEVDEVPLEVGLRVEPLDASAARASRTRRAGHRGRRARARATRSTQSSRTQRAGLAVEGARSPQRRRPGRAAGPRRSPGAPDAAQRPGPRDRPVRQHAGQVAQHGRGRQGRRLPGEAVHALPDLAHRRRGGPRPRARPARPSPRRRTAGRRRGVGGEPGRVLLAERPRRCRSWPRPGAGRAGSRRTPRRPCR